MKDKPRRSVVIIARLITVVVSLAGAEGVLWFGGYPTWWRMDQAWSTPGATNEYECDPDLGWIPRQGKFDLVWSGLRDQPVRTTNWAGGQRATSDDPPAAASSERLKVQFFGDSFIQGYGLSDSETLAWIVQKRHPDLEVSNFGAGSYGTYQSYLAIKKHVHGPSSIYYLFNGFHEDRNVADRSWLRVYKKSPPGCFFPFAEMSGSALAARRSEGDVVWTLSRHMRIVALVQEYKEIFETYLRVRRKQEVTETLLAKMNDAVRAEGGHLTVIVLDLLPKDHQHYTAFLQSHHIEFLDASDLDSKNRGLRLADGHPNPQLNELLAEKIEPTVMAWHAASR